MYPVCTRRRGRNVAAIEDSAYTRALIRGYIEIWRRAVQLQAARVRNAQSDVDREADAPLFAVALRDLLRAVRWAKVHADTTKDGQRSQKLHTALADFEARIPHSVEMRDFLEHFDDYERESKRRKVRVQSFSLWYENLGGETTLTIDNYKLRVQDAADAAERLAAAAAEALS